MDKVSFINGLRLMVFFNQRLPDYIEVSQEGFDAIEWGRDRMSCLGFEPLDQIEFRVRPDFEGGKSWPYYAGAEVRPY